MDIEQFIKTHLDVEVSPPTFRTAFFRPQGGLRGVLSYAKINLKLWWKISEKGVIVK